MQLKVTSFSLIKVKIMSLWITFYLNLTYDRNMSIEISEHFLSRQLRIELDGKNELRKALTIQAEAWRSMVGQRYNSKVKLISSNKGDQVWKKTNEVPKKLTYGKLASSQERPFKIVENLKNEAYHLQQHPNRKSVPNTWNVSHLNLYFS